MLETAAVIARDGRVLHWHTPEGRSHVALPDSRALWEVLWQHRAEVAGIAHSHPGTGVPRPSWEDLTTFAACEDGLGVRLSWWIATQDQLRCFRWQGPDRFRYRALLVATPDPDWLLYLREQSHFERQQPDFFQSPSQ